MPRWANTCVKVKRPEACRAAAFSLSIHDPRRDLSLPSRQAGGNSATNATEWCRRKPPEPWDLKVYLSLFQMSEAMLHSLFVPRRHTKVSFPLTSWSLKVTT